MRDASNSGKTLAISGHDSKAFRYTPSGDAVLKTLDHRGIVEYRPDELVISVRAGTPLNELNQVVAEHNQILPPDPPQFDGRGTVGGAVATATTSPSMPWLGGIRDSLLGTQLINGKGEQLKFGGKVIKNVAGYDISRLLAGSLGTLGVVLDATFKLLPKPEATRTVAKQCSAVDAHRLVSRLNRVPGTLSCTCFFEETLSLRFSGSARAVSSEINRIDEVKDVDNVSFWEQLRDHDHPFFFGDEPLWCLLLDRGRFFECDQDVNYLSEWNGTRVWLRSQEDLRRYRMQASLVIPYRNAERPDRNISKYAARLKKAFDPHNTFNPGIVV